MYPSTEALRERTAALHDLEALTPAIRWSRRSAHRADLARRRGELEADLRATIARHDAVTVYQVRARPSGGGWEVSIEGVGITRAPSPDAIDAAVRRAVTRKIGKAADQFEWVYAP